MRERSRAYALLLRAGWSGCPAWPGVEVVEALVFLLAAARSGGSSSGSANGEATDSAARQRRGSRAGRAGSAVRAGRGWVARRARHRDSAVQYSTPHLSLGFFFETAAVSMQGPGGFPGDFSRGKGVDAVTPGVSGGWSA